MKGKFKRKAIPDRVKLIAALRRFGLTIDQVQFDHNPALGLRVLNEHTGDTIPPSNDPGYIEMLLVDEHKLKTFGKGGEKRITTADGDIGRIAKVERLTTSQEDFRRRLMAKEAGDKPAKKSSWPKRPMTPRNHAKKGHGNDRRNEEPDPV